MTRKEAMDKAFAEFGRGAVIGVNHQNTETPVFVAKKAEGQYLKLGAGKTWEEAFANVQDVKLKHPPGNFRYRELSK
jgi:hypothetical protein